MSDAIDDVLGCIRKHRERLDVEIAAEVSLPVDVVRGAATALIATGSIIACSVTRFDREERIDAWMYRIAGYVPPPAPGRKPRPAA